MSDPLFEEDSDATPLTEEEKQQLIPSYITLRSELNEAEQRNILGDLLLLESRSPDPGARRRKR